MRLGYLNRRFFHGTVRLSRSEHYFAQDVLDPPAGWAGLVSGTNDGETVVSAYNDPRRSYVPDATWISSSYGGGMRYKDYQTPQDGSVYWTIAIFARLDCRVDFYVLFDDNDSANFVITEDARILSQSSSRGPSSNVPGVAASVTLTPGAHTLQFQVMSGISIYVSKIEVVIA